MRAGAAADSEGDFVHPQTLTNKGGSHNELIIVVVWVEICYDNKNRYWSGNDIAYSGEMGGD